MDVVEVAESLTEAQRRDLTANWDHYCQCDYDLIQTDDENYPDQLEEAGFVFLDGVNEDDLDQFFADELGIIEGGSVYRFTPLGIAVRAHLSDEGR